MSTDLAASISATSIAERWAARFAEALRQKNHAEVLALLAPEAWWRDLYALTWDITAAHGSDQIMQLLDEAFRYHSISHLEISRTAEPNFDAADAITAFISFATDVGECAGVVRLTDTGGSGWRAWVVSTELRGLKHHPESKVTIAEASSDTHNKPVAPHTRVSWEEWRQRQVDFESDNPEVVIVGAGHSGLFLAARLERLGVRTLLVEKHARIGDNWRKRYSGLLLHDTKWYAQFPYMPYPDVWPLFTPKELLADWMAAYVEFLQLNVWTDTRVGPAEYDAGAGCWHIELKRMGVSRIVRAGHLVLATGLNGVADKPRIPGAEEFSGEIVHSSEYVGGPSVDGKKLVVVGAATSAMDIAQDAYENGASVTLVQRGPTYVMSQRHGIPAFHGVYYAENSPPVEQADMLAASMPMALLAELAGPITRAIAEKDSEMLSGLAAVGFATTLGPNDCGILHLGLTRGGGYYIDKGAAQLIIDRDVRVQRGEISAVTRDGVVYDDGTTEVADIIVLATGYGDMRENARPILGSAVADTLGPVWGLDSTGELRSTFRHSGHPRLWFMAGGLQQCRVHSRHVALAIKAIQEGYLDADISVQKRRN